MTAPRVLGLDLSLTCTGFVSAATGLPGTIAARIRGVDRLDQLEQFIVALAGDADLVVLEEYAFHGRNAHSHELGELGGVVRLGLHRAGICWVPVNPSSLKRYATGKGNASKEEVLAAAIRRLDYAGHSNDEADAMWLRAMALDHYGHPLAAVPETHRQALAKVQWPTLEAAAA